MNKRSVVVMVVEWNTEESDNPETWDWDDVVAASGGEVTDLGVRTLDRSMTTDDVAEMMEEMVRVAEDLIDDAAVVNRDMPVIDETIQSDQPLTGDVHARLSHKRPSASAADFDNDL